MLDEKPYWDIKALSGYLNIKPGTLYAWVAQGRIPCLKIHGLLRFRPKEIENWVASFRVDPTPRITRSTPSRGPSSELDTLIARAKGQAYNSQPRGNQTEIKPHRKGGT